MSEPENRSLVSATAVTVEGDVYLEDLTAAGGRLNFRSATLGPVLAADARIDNPAGETLMLSQATVRGSLNLVDGFISAGTLELNLTRVEGRLLLRDGTFTSPQPGGGRPAIEAISASAAGGIDLGWREATPARRFHQRDHNLPRRRPGDLAGALSHQRADLRPVRASAGIGASSGLGPGSPPGLARPAGEFRLRYLRAGGPGVPAARLRHRGRADPHRPATACPRGEPVRRGLAARGPDPRCTHSSGTASGRSGSCGCWRCC